MDHSDGGSSSDDGAAASSDDSEVKKSGWFSTVHNVLCSKLCLGLVILGDVGVSSKLGFEALEKLFQRVVEVLYCIPECLCNLLDSLFQRVLEVLCCIPICICELFG